MTAKISRYRRRKFTCGCGPNPFYKADTVYTTYIGHQPLAWVITERSADGPTDGPTDYQTDGQTIDELTN